MQKTAYEMRISDWSSDVCSSDLEIAIGRHRDCPFAAAEKINLLAVKTPALALHGGNPIESICEARGRNLRRDHRPRLAIFSHCPNRTACDLRQTHHRIIRQIGRASCRERVCQYV